MQVVTLRIPDRNYPGFLKIIEGLEYVERVKEPAVKPSHQAEEPSDDYRPKTKEEIKADIREAWDELIEVRAGRKEARPAREVLEEIRRELGQ